MTARTEARAVEPFFMGGDVSLLPFIESRGGTFRDGGQVRPLEQILVNRGNNLFRLRLFVNPDPNYDDATNHGAIQDHAYTIALAQRLKVTGARILLDLHYSDTWADPGNQAKPAAWAGQNFATLQTTVRNYTRDTLASFRDAGVMPDMVQVGNETTNGMLYGTTVVPATGGQVVYTGPNQNQSWANFGTLLNAAIAGVRDVDGQTAGQHTQVAVHVDGGDVAGRAQYFFDQLTDVAQVPAASYDVMGMSFYGTTSASLATLDTNLTHLANNHPHQVMVLETNKRWKGSSSGAWPSTPAGQRDFLVAVRDVVRNLPNDRGRGVVWWYPESIQIPGTFIWQSGAVALFDDDADGSGGVDGHDALAALGAFAVNTMPTWRADADGDWYDAMNWSGGVPMFAGNAAQFGPVATSPRTVTLNGSRSAAIVGFDSVHRYTVAAAGGSVLTLDAVAGRAAINVAAGSHTIAAPLVLNDDLDVVTPPGSTLTVTGALTATGRTIGKSEAGAVEFRNIRAARLDVSGGVVRVMEDGTAAGASRIGTISLTGAGKLDVTNNQLVTTTPVGGWDGSKYTGMTGLIQSGRNGGGWDGAAAGLITSMASAINSGDLATLGLATAAQAKGIATTATTIWAGQTVLGGDSLVMFTWGGDANLDEKIDIDDYGQIDFNIGSSGSGFGWFNGDFNYDGKIDIDDYGIIDFNVAAQASGMSIHTSRTPGAGGALEAGTVPEPGGVALAAVALGAVARRRGRRVGSVAKSNQEFATAQPAGTPVMSNCSRQDRGE